MQNGRLERNLTFHSKVTNQNNSPSAFTPLLQNFRALTCTEGSGCWSHLSLISVGVLILDAAERTVLHSSSLVRHQNANLENIQSQPALWLKQPTELSVNQELHAHSPSRGTTGRVWGEAISD